ncbi:MAG: 50S ribosomal protein L10 [Chthoniobacterales bacterium]
MRPEKATIISDLTTKLNSSPYLLITDYTGLKVDQFSELRKRLAGVGAECRVVKNTMLRLAAKEAGIPDLGELHGQTAVVVGERDVSAAAKVVKTFAAEFEKPVMRLGVLDNAVITIEQIKELAELPTLDVLRAKLLGLFLAPASKLVRTLNEPAASLARVLNAKTGGVTAEESAPAVEEAAKEEAPAATAPAEETTAAAPTEAAPAAPAAEETK